MATSFCVLRLEESFQYILLHVVMFKTIFLVIVGIITGLRICWFSNTHIVWMVWGFHIKSFSKIFQPMLNYCRKFENIKFLKIWHCKVGAFFLGHPVWTAIRFKNYYKFRQRRIRICVKTDALLLHVYFMEGILFIVCYCDRMVKVRLILEYVLIFW